MSLLDFVDLIIYLKHEVTTENYTLKGIVRNKVFSSDIEPYES